MLPLVQDGENKQLRTTGGVGGNFKIISGDVQRINSNNNNWRESGSINTVSAMVYKVATSDMRDSDKISQIQDIAERIGGDRSITPQDIPDSKHVMTGEKEVKPAKEMERVLRRKPPESPEL